MVYREYIQRVISQILGESQTVRTNLPSTARISLNRQSKERRLILHLLYANTISRGGKIRPCRRHGRGFGSSIEVIEDLLPLIDTRVTLHGLPKIARATLEPTGEEIPITSEDETISLTVPKFVLPPDSGAARGITRKSHAAR